MRNSYKLTHFPIGSLREIMTVSCPLILGLLSNSLMMFADRLFLANYSLESLSASGLVTIGGHFELYELSTTSGVLTADFSAFLGPNFVQNDDITMIIIKNIGIRKKAEASFTISTAKSREVETKSERIWNWD